jgi:hypothetical protein
MGPGVVDGSTATVAVGGGVSVGTDVGKSTALAVGGKGVVGAGLVGAGIAVNGAIGVDRMRFGVEVGSGVDSTGVAAGLTPTHAAIRSATRSRLTPRKTFISSTSVAHSASPPIRRPGGKREKLLSVEGRKTLQCRVDLCG